MRDIFPPQRMRKVPLAPAALAGFISGKHGAHCRGILVKGHYYYDFKDMDVYSDDSCG